MVDRVVGVVGAGVMGSGLAQAAASAGHEVILVDVSEAVLEGAMTSIRTQSRSLALLRKGPSPGDVLSRIKVTTDLGRLAAATFVVENVTEKWAVKEPVYRQLDEICPAGCVFAANTSAISITRIAAATRRPADVLGIHFMNPVPTKPLVEIIPGHHTSEATIQRARGFLASMGKDGVLVRDSVGFVSNRVLMMTINEAIQLVHEGVASAEDVDRIFVGCFAHAMGPLATADLIGLDTILLSIEVLREGYGDMKFVPCPLLQRMVNAGLLGRKSGRGFFDYSGTAA